MAIVLIALVVSFVVISMLGDSGNKAQRRSTPSYMGQQSQPWSSRPMSQATGQVRQQRGDRPRTTSTPRPASKRGSGRVFSVINPEGEVYSIDTGDRNSPFFGPAWSRILEANERGECFRGKAIKRSCGRTDGAFHGYFIDIGGVQAFLPVSKAAWFYNPDRDACGKFLALTLESIYPNGHKRGNMIVNAYAPLKHVLFSQNREAFCPDATPWALAMDYDADSLIFPHMGNKVIRVPLREASKLAQSKGMGKDYGSLTGRFWKVRIQTWKPGGVCSAHPVDIMSD